MHVLLVRGVKVQRLKTSFSHLLEETTSLENTNNPGKITIYPELNRNCLHLNKANGDPSYFWARTTVAFQHFPEVTEACFRDQFQKEG